MKRLYNPTQEQWYHIWLLELINAEYIENNRELIIPSFNLFDGLFLPYTEDKILFKGSAREHVKKINKKVTVLRPVSYTPDDIIPWTKKAENIFYIPFESDPRTWNSCYFKAMKSPNEDLYYSIIDIKAPTGTHRHSDTPFSFTQKWLWYRQKLYVQKVMLAPAKPKFGINTFLFESTFTPQRFLWTDKVTKLRKINHYVPRTLEEFITKKTL
ncbi:hypothetical protein LCGC14_2772940 [marine sediment metagenome]|uniref:Uncharacterized protein n=1 Tax=marine sediment metagenome TaxID=412755 RepID=A0A0F9B4A8_9ZZZZ